MEVQQTSAVAATLRLFYVADAAAAAAAAAAGPERGQQVLVLELELELLPLPLPLPPVVAAGIANQPKKAFLACDHQAKGLMTDASAYPFVTLFAPQEVLVDQYFDSTGFDAGAYRPEQWAFSLA